MKQTFDDLQPGQHITITRAWADAFNAMEGRSFRVENRAVYGYPMRVIAVDLPYVLLGVPDQQRHDASVWMLDTRLGLQWIEPKPEYLAAFTFNNVDRLSKRGAT